MEIQKQKIENFIAETHSEAALMFDATGNLIFSVHCSHDDSVAAMSNAILSMCDKFLDDLEKGLLKQVFIKTTTHIVVFNTIKDATSLVVFSKLGTNLGLFLHNVEEFVAELKQM